MNERKEEGHAVSLLIPYSASHPSLPPSFLPSLPPYLHQDHRLLHAFAAIPQAGVEQVHMLLVAAFEEDALGIMRR